jgi:transglutaminase-like putative cysteine protease
MRELAEILVRTLRYPLWIFVAAVATLCLVSPFTDGYGQVAAILGTLAGGLLGEGLGRSRLRLPWLMAAAAAGVVGLVVLDWLFVSWWPLALVAGPVPALHISNFVGFGGGGLVIGAALRVLGNRGSSGRALELGAAAAAVAFAFAAHRDGSIARPLWLSDRAWDAGLDPVNIILVVGMLLGIAIPMLMLLESRRKLPLLAPFALPLIVLIAFLWTDPAALQTPPQVSELDNIQDGYAGGQDEHDEWESHSGGGSGDGEEPARGKAGKGGKAGGKAGGENPAEGQGGSDSGGASEGSSAGDVQESLEEGGSDGPPTPVAVIILGDDYSPPTEAYYLRQEPHSQFNGTRLIKAVGDVRDEDFLDYFAVGTTSLQKPQPGHRVRIQGTVSLLVDHTAPFGIEAPTDYWPTRNPNSSRFVRTYGFASLAQNTPHERLIGLRAGDAGWTPEQWAHYTEGPVDPRYQELAQRIVADLPDTLRDDPFARALKIKLYLDENMKYQRSARHADAEDPTADFLFGNMIGYCVHSAHASVFLWRSLGLPARIGTGYLVPEEQRRGSALLVQDNQAHAWPELYLADVGWVVLDVAPGENLDPPSPPIDEAMLDALADLAREQEPQTERNPVNYAALWRAVKLLGGFLLGTLLLGLVSGHYTVKVWRRARPLLGSGRSLPRVGYRASLDRLAEAGIRREVGETREHFAQRIAETVPSFTPLTQMHLMAALGHPAQPVDAAAWRSGMAAVHAELRARTTWWRRILGFINPFSFYRAR